MITDFRAAYEPIGSGVIKSVPEDFRVDEKMSWNFSDSGEHLYCRIRKSGLGTAEAIKKVAKQLRCQVRDIGYAGLKDKHAVSSQWISIPFKYRRSDWSCLAAQGITVLETRRHYRKLRQGILQGNSFVIRIRQCQVSRRSLSQRIKVLRSQGFPNYFGQQRFGPAFANLHCALSYLTADQTAELTRKNGFYLSCLRSYLFNLVLSERVRLNVWHALIAGDIVQLAGSHSVFVNDGTDSGLAHRFMCGDILPAGLLWGGKRLNSQQQARQIERMALTTVDDVVNWFDKQVFKAGYRAYAVCPGNLRILEYNPDDCLLAFDLAPGQYATELLKNIFRLVDE